MHKKEIFLAPNKENSEEIRKQIQLDVSCEVKTISARAKEEADLILKNAQDEAERKKQEASLELDKQIKTIKEKILSGINLEKKRINLGEKNKLIEEIFVQIKLQAEVFRSSGEYRDFLKKAAVEAVKVIDSLSLDILYSAYDAKLINEEFQEEVRDFCRSKTGKNISLAFVKNDFKDIGFIVQSKDGKIIFDNTFLARLRRAYDDMYMDLLRKL